MHRFFVILRLAVLIAVALQAAAVAQTTEFTYQGSLTQNGSPATGNFDFEFALYDALSAGSQVGPAITLNNVAVAAGVFSVKLDFGNQFPGSNRFLEIRVRQAGGGAFTALSPRQLINSSPYSVRSLSADNATNAANAVNATNATTAVTANNALQLGGVAANQYVLTGDLRLSDARNPLPGSTNYIQNQAAIEQTASFRLGGTGYAIVFIADDYVSARKSFRIDGAPVLSTAGNNNLFVGIGAGAVNSTGGGNAFFGSGAGAGNTTGNANAFFGSGAGAATTTASQNSYFGSSAGNSNTTGSFNSFFGSAAGFSNTEGWHNSFFGVWAGNHNTTGFYNSFFGNSAGNDNTTGASNSFFGNSAGLLTTTGNSNSFFGDSAGGSNTTGSANAFFGRSAGISNTTGIENTTLGVSANVGAGGLRNATAIGSHALVSTSNSLVLGSISGQNGAAASTNVGIGISAPSERLHVVGNGLFTGNLTVNGTLNAGLPSGSASYIQNQNAAPQASSNFNISGTGTANIFNAVTQYNIGGNRVLSAAGTGNLFAGFNAGQALTTGIWNSFLGVGAGQSNTTGNSNSFFGNGSGSSNTEGNNNSFFGFATAATNITGNNNTLIGYGADVGGVNLMNASAIGSRAFVAQSNSLVLGSINSVNGATASTKVGIGTTTPNAALAVRGGNAWTSASWTGSVTLGNGSAIGWEVNSAGNRWGIGSTNTGLHFFATTDAFGTTSSPPNYFLIIKDSGFVQLNNLSSAGTAHLCINASNDISSCSSSARYKSNITGYSSGLDLIQRLRPVSFNWKDGGMPDFGLVAEEVAAVEPLLTTTNSKGEIEGVKYERVGVVLVNAVREQQAQIEALEEQNQAQQKQLDEQGKIIAEQKLNVERQRAEIEILKQLVCSQNRTAVICTP